MGAIRALAPELESDVVWTENCLLRTQGGQDQFKAQHNELDIVQMVRRLWVYRRSITAVTVLSVVLSAWLVFMLPRSYRAEATLLIVPAKLGSERIARLDKSTVQSYVTIAQNKELILEIFQDIKAELAPWITEYEQLLQVILVEHVRDTNLIRLAVVLGDSSLAAKIANRLAQKCVDLSRRLTSYQASDSKEFLETQVEESLRQLEEARAVLVAFEREARLPILQRKLQIQLDLKAKLEQLSVQKERELLGQTSRLKELQVQLAGQSKTLRLSRAIVENPAFEQLLANATGVDPSALIGLTMEAEVVNSVHDVVEKDFVRTTVNVVNLKANYEKLIAQLKQVEDNLETLVQQSIERENEHARLKQNLALAMETHRTMNREYQQAKLLVMGRSEELRLVERAVPSMKPVAPKRKLIVGFAALGGFFFSLCAALVFDLIRQVD